MTWTTLPAMLNAAGVIAETDVLKDKTCYFEKPFVDSCCM